MKRYFVIYLVCGGSCIFAACADEEIATGTVQIEKEFL